MSNKSTKFSPEQIATLKQNFGAIKTCNPDGVEFNKFRQFVRQTMTEEQRQQMVDENVPWLRTVVESDRRALQGSVHDALRHFYGVSDPVLRIERN